MAPPITITPWIGKLIDSELENIIAWKSIVKPEPGTSDEDIPSSRFEERASNLRSVVGSPPLDSDSKLQLRTSVNQSQNSRHPLLMSDGETTVLAKLNDTAWDAYEKGLDDEEPMKGDVLICTRITIISTSDGPEEKRVQLRIDDLNFLGENSRRPIGNSTPTPVHQRESVVESLRKIARIRAKQNEMDAMDEDGDEIEDDDENENENEDDANEDGDDADVMEEDIPSHTAAEQAVPGAQPDSAAHVESSQRSLEPESPTLPRDQTSPNLSKSTTDAQIESQLPAAPQTQISQPPRLNAFRRSRGGAYSLGREGVEVARGDNLAGPQAPMLPRNHLLEVINKTTDSRQRKRSPEPSAPVSAQVVREEVVVETPVTKKRSVVSTVRDSTSTLVRHKRHQIPDDQQKLLDDISSWIPPVAGQQFPHPNVPIDLLQAWNARAMATQAVSQPSPLPTIDPGAKSVEEVQPEARPEPPQDSESDTDNQSDKESDEESVSESQQLPWSSSPPRQPELPPDSSAVQSSAHVSRPTSRDDARSNGENLPSSSNRANGAPNRRNIPQVSDRQPGTQSGKVAPHVSQTPYADRRERASGSGQSTPSSNTPVIQRPEAQQRSGKQSVVPSRPSSTSSAGFKIPSSSSRPVQNRGEPRSHAAPSASQSVFRLPNSTEAPTDSHRINPPTQPVFRLPMSTQAMADNHQGPVRPSAQRSAVGSDGGTSQRAGMPPSSNSSAPKGAPTGPKYPNRGPGSSQARRNRQSSDYYRSYGTPPSNNRNSLGTQPQPQPKSTPSRLSEGTQPPNGTNRMEEAVPRAMQPTHDARSAHMRDQQRRHWLDTNLSSNDDVAVLPSLIWTAYRKAHPNDPVSQEAFEILVEEYRPVPPRKAAPPQECETSIEPAKRATASSLKRMSRTSASIGPRTSVIDDYHESPREKEARLHNQPSRLGVWSEFVQAWKNVMPGGSFAHDDAQRGVDGERKRRRLDVLSWGFGE
ncbi:hypothetical protein Q7P37_007556 [Cladosporium fusiforme]